MAKSTALQKEPEAVPQAAPEPVTSTVAPVCGTCRNWEPRANAFGICNLSGKFLPSPLPTTNTTSCAAWQA
jgi:hypothetical protein